MATVSSVIAKIRGLISDANAATGRDDTTLTPAVRALIAGQGSGGGGGFVDVDILPTTNIKPNTVYRLYRDVIDLPKVYICVEGMLGTFPELIAAEGGTANQPIYVVEKLPDVMEPFSEVTITIPTYIIESTGMAYISMDGTSAGAVPFGMLLGEGVPEFGWVDTIEGIDPNNVEHMGIYTLRGKGAIREIDGLYIYLDGAWTRYKEVIDVTELSELYEMATNVIYRVGEIITEPDLYYVMSGGVIQKFTDYIAEHQDTVTVSAVEFVDILPETPDDATVYVLNSSGEMYAKNGDTLENTNNVSLFLLMFGKCYGWADADEVNVHQTGFYSVRPGMIVSDYYVYTGKVLQVYSGTAAIQALAAGTLKELKAKDLSGVGSTAAYAFYLCNSLEKVTLSDSMYNINTSTFEGCASLKEVVVTPLLMGIGPRAFYGCTALESINLDVADSWWDIHDRAFAKCSSLKQIDIHDSTVLFTLGSYVFEDCTSLVDARITPSDTGLSEGIFSGCTALKTVTICLSNTFSEIPSKLFYRCSSLEHIYVNDSMFCTKQQWKNMTKGQDWDTGTGNYIVHCYDGTIAKDGTET